MESSLLLLVVSGGRLVGMELEELVKEYRSRLLYFCVGAVRDRALAEELTQQALMIALEAVKKERLDDREKLGAFLYGVARNLVKKHFRDTQTSERILSSYEPDPRPLDDPETLVLLQEKRRLVRRALEQLDEEDRKLLKLNLSDGEDLESAAGQLGISYAAARKRKSRALEKLRNWLDPSQIRS